MARSKVSEERKVGRLLSRLLAGVLLLGLLGFWASFGFYRLNPGEAAVILRLGKYRTTEVREGLRWHLPPPIESREIVNVGLVAREQFGDIDTASEAATLTETAMQTGDNNIVDLEFVVKYKIGRAFESRFRIANLRETLRDSAQAAMREVVGRNSVDDVLSEKRGIIQDEAAELLQQILDRYESGLHVEGIELQEVQPPAPVRDAFDDVIAAAQDRNRKVNEAEGYANEVLPGARAEASEVVEAAIGYRDSKIAEAAGEAERFLAIVREYQKAPEITRKRLYLETMEEVLPGVEKVIIEPGTASVLPYLPLGTARKEPRP
jgi:membrane protease subunit HflK